MRIMELTHKNILTFYASIVYRVSLYFPPLIDKTIGVLVEYGQCAELVPLARDYSLNLAIVKDQEKIECFNKTGRRVNRKFRTAGACVY